ncbi:MAG TPA: trigger factor [Patescibacteria group bacterium]|nr:trigger factor [Patescibacteria group bacterium]
MNTKLTKQDDGTIELGITIPWSEIQSRYGKKVDELINEVEIKGFRKGKAPRELAEKELKKSAVYEEMIKTMVPEVYAEAIKRHNLKPIIQPEIKLSEAQENKDWIVTIFTCEKPSFSIADYKKTISLAKAELKRDDLWLPGKEIDEKQKQESTEEKRRKTLDSILTHLVREANITIPAILIKAEVDRRLSVLVDELAKLGLTIETYARSKNLTPQQIRQNHEQEMRTTVALEFILEHIADKEKVTIGKDEIDRMLNKLEDEKERESLAKNQYLVADLLRRQKTFDLLLNL